MSFSTKTVKSVNDDVWIVAGMCPGAQLTPTQWSVQDLVHTAVSFMCETLGLNQVIESTFRQN